jgi:hypothetical protein
VSIARGDVARNGYIYVLRKLHSDQVLL